jgi:hypothetical protein
MIFLYCFETFFDLTNIYGFALEMGAETHVGYCVKHLLFLTVLYQNVSHVNLRESVNGLGTCN